MVVKCEGLCSACVHSYSPVLTEEGWVGSSRKPSEDWPGGRRSGDTRGKEVDGLTREVCDWTKKSGGGNTAGSTRQICRERPSEKGSRGCPRLSVPEWGVYDKRIFRHVPVPWQESHPESRYQNTQTEGLYLLQGLPTFNVELVEK